MNLILHHFDYAIEVSIREPASGQNPNANETPETSKLTIKTKVKKSVYATPHKIHIDTRKKDEEITFTYPNIFFAIVDFDETWKNIVLSKEGELVCVELYAYGDFFGKRIRLFAGALDYSVIKQHYTNNVSLWFSKEQQFFSLQGPGGKGQAQMLVTPIQPPSSSTSSSPASNVELSPNETLNLPPTPSEDAIPERKRGFLF